MARQSGPASIFDPARKGVICPRCRREARGWPLRRADVCSPKGWESCLREPDAVIAKAASKVSR